MEAQILLMGPEGCGKTTFAQQLRHLYESRELAWPAARAIKVQPTSGQDLYSISFKGGRVVKRPKVKEWVRTQAGMSRSGERVLRRWENTPMEGFEGSIKGDGAGVDGSGGRLSTVGADSTTAKVTAMSNKGGAPSHSNSKLHPTTPMSPARPDRQDDAYRTLNGVDELQVSSLAANLGASAQPADGSSDGGGPSGGLLGGISNLLVYAPASAPQTPSYAAVSPSHVAVTTRTKGGGGGGGADGGKSATTAPPPVVVCACPPELRNPDAVMAAMEGIPTQPNPTIPPPQINMAAVTTLQRNNNTGSVMRGGNSGNNIIFSMVDHTYDAGEFVSPPPKEGGDGGGGKGADKDGHNAPLTRKDAKAAKLSAVGDKSVASTTNKDGNAASTLINHEASTNNNNIKRSNSNANSVVQEHNVDHVRKVFPDDDDSFSKFTVDVQEVGGRMLSLLPKFISKLNLLGAHAESADVAPQWATLNPNASAPEGIFIFMIDLTNPDQIPTAAIELSYLRQTYLRQSKGVRRRWCVVANKAMSVLAGGAPPVSHGRVAGGSVLSAGGVDAAEIGLVRRRVKQLLLLPDHPDFSEDDDEDEDNYGEDATSANAPPLHSRRETKIVSADGLLQRPAVAEDFLPPIFIVDTWTGLGFGDVVAWLEDR